MRLHLVALPQTQTTDRFLTCAYTQKIVKFCRMMEHTHEVTLYSGDQNDAPCREHVPLFSEQTRAAFWPNGFNPVTDHISWSPGESYWQWMNTAAVAAIRERAQPHDLVLLTGGLAQQPVAQQLAPMLAVEWAVGYEGCFADYRGFESYAWMHHIYGRQGIGDGRFYDAVIPNFFDPADFHTAPKQDYLLYLGRLVTRKGPHVAAQIANRVGMRLIVAGPGCQHAEPGRIVCLDGTELVGDVTYHGVLDQQQRAMFLAAARALLAPTLDLEPFGGAAVEAMLSGTPAVTTDFGAYTETVTEETGRRFRTLAQGADAVQQVLELDPAAIREHALARYSLDAVRPRFNAWFEQLHGLWNGGWNT